ncbi:ABC transporter substrate-binding protein [Sneathiella chinensis]|uniref:ABC transporter substrate-binding protein n=1 Tax=Sneathiella chinensis TaxID=349750 RepID=A0ABQ5U3E5_9PROT|nr:ABC transporter substrate-binding protein [Sneathiella chinensis]GLQ06722.1 ABC transporter substrate-binding protein [Sneathiella chinensis]
MKLRHGLMAAVAAAAIAVAAPVAKAETFKYAFQGSLSSLDPHSLNETFLLGTLGNIYEGLVIYDENLTVTPGLAESWEIVEPTKWKFNLRKGVKFHNGNDFTAEDVVFSWQRALSEGSDQKVRAAKIKNIEVVDDHTIIIETPAPNPILTSDLYFVYMMDKTWSEENNTTEATSPSADTTGNFANLNANGTGPFKVTEHKADVKTTFERHADYWGNMKSNVTRIEFTPIKEAATRVAALISGELDLVYPVPVQDWQRLDDAAGVKSLAGPEARTIFLGMDQGRDELLYSNIKGKNPFKDIRVRQAMAHGINLEAIKQKVMRGASTPAGLMVAPQINGFVAELNTPYAYDPKKSKELLAEAGYPDGFEVTLDCPNNRYVNDEKICQAVVSMLAKVGVKVDLLAQPKSKYFGKILATGGFDTSFYMLGWTPGTVDSENAMSSLLACQNAETKVGLFNLGNYCNPRVDELTAKVGSETDQDARNAMIKEAFQIVKDEVGYLPIHQQPLSWGVRDGVSVVQRADNILDFRNVVVGK